jgi:GNAT superfamily N-acetyltransferase
MEWNRNGYTVSTDRKRIDIKYVHSFLTRSYWATGIPAAVVERSVSGSLCFGIYKDGQQVGFARVITDEATFAYLADVFVDEKFRGQGLAAWMMELILAYPSLQGLRRFLLATRDAHALYLKLGFTPIPDAGPWMQIHQPGVYKEKP